MDILSFLQPFGLPIDTIMIFLIILSGQFQKKYLDDINIGGTKKTLIVSLFFCGVYAWLFSVAYHYEKELPLKWFFSYVTGTSLYELFLKKFLDKFSPDNQKP